MGDNMKKDWERNEFIYTCQDHLQLRVSEMIWKGATGLDMHHLGGTCCTQEVARIRGRQRLTCTKV